MKENHDSPLAPSWLKVPTDVNALRSIEWAKDVERNKEGELSIDSIPVSSLAAQYGTPLFVMSEGDFRARARAFRSAFTEAFARIGTEVDVFYAGKSFLSRQIVRWVQEEGLNLDTCSQGEMSLGLSAGMPAERMGLHGNNKSREELERALESGLGRIVTDSLDELGLLEEVAAERGIKAPVMLRLKPGVHAHTHEAISTAHEDQKFGLSMVQEQGSERSEAAEAAARAHASEHLELLGVHAHVGSQIFEPTGFELSAEKLLTFLGEFRDEHGIELPELDLGGGYGIAYTSEDEPRPILEIAQASADVVERVCRELNLRIPRISIEPGRAIVGPTTFTLYETGTIKDVCVDVPEAQPEAHQSSQKRRYISVDGGMSDNPRPVLYDADYTAVLANRPSDQEPRLSRVVGKHCESGDIVVRDVYLPADVRAGDLLAVPATGAYCWALSSNYNYALRPAVVAVSSGQSRMIVRRETEEDLFSRDMG